GEHFLRSGSESCVNVSAEAAAGYLKAACQELAGVRYRVIDFSGFPSARRRSTLLAELCDPQPSGREVACRDSGQLVARTIESRVDNRVLFQPLAFELEPGTIVISGGMGGLGKRLAQDLLRHAPAARIALFGRSAHDLQPEDWPALSPADFERLEYHPADFSDAATVMRALGDTPVSALFHLAGVARSCPAADESLDEVAAVVRPKAGAEATLRAIARRHPRCLIFAASSSMGHLVEPGLAAYAAANRGLEAVVEALRKEGSRAFAVVLGAFDQVGMNDQAEAVEYQRARGYRLLSAAHVLDACRLAYAYPARTFLFGAPAVDASLEARASSQADAPAHPRMRELLEIFATTTGCPVDARALHRTYFELGADSLKLTRFRQALEAKWGIDLPTSTLYRRNTLAQLCDELAAAGVDAQGAASVPLIKLVTGTDPDATPLLLIPPAGGVIAPYSKLITALPTAGDVWGFEDPSIHDLEGRDWELGTLIDAMAELVARKISRPPVVLSYSGGGFIAWALTHRLNQRGLPPPLLVLVDTYLIEHPYRLADAVHALSMALDRGAAGATVRALFHAARALNAPLPRKLREAASRSRARRNTTFQCLYETQRYYHGWQQSLSRDAMSRESFDDALDVACELVEREDPKHDTSRLRRILTHACVLVPRRLLQFFPERLPNDIAVFEVEKGKLTIKNLLESYTDNIVHHEHIAVPSYATLEPAYFRFTDSASAVKHFLCMYDEHFVGTLAASVSAVMQRAR
ncbi:MAG TPA: KR domain-containing protein, partial [Polyangiales bacterium]|nr:KR domain-containing protein [Polyangiales bacterium]